MRRRRPVHKFIACLLMLALMLGQVLTFAPSVKAAEDTVSTLVLTGTGLEHDVVVSEDDWNDLVLEERIFSSNNSYNFHKINKVKGYDLFSTLIGNSNLKTDEDYGISFIASDGFKKSKTVSALTTQQYVYRNFTEASKELVKPMVGIYKKEIFSLNEGYQGFTWDDVTLGESDKIASPQIIFGQTNMDDMNQSNWVGELIKIKVGEERDPIITFKGTGATQTKSFNLAELALMPDNKKITDSYSYSDPVKTDYVEGVDLYYLITSQVGVSSQNVKIKFLTADAYESSEISLSDISTEKYVLAYKKGSAAASATLINDQKNYEGQAINGQLRVYGKDSTLIKYVSEIVITADAGGGSTDFTISPFKHINAGAPYNVDSITGATLTVEGPGVTAMRALSVRQLEEANAGLFRGDYTDLRNGTVKNQIFEGIKLSHILENMVTRKDSAAKVLIKDRSRQLVKEFTLQQIEDSDDSGKPILLAYGVGEEDGEENLTAKPFVYNETDAGYDSALENDNGCLRLVYDQGAAPTESFETGAYIYLEEATVPGYEHDSSPYNDPDLTQYMLTITGTGVGKEVTYTVDDLEQMTDIRYTGEYSLSNSEYYWYYNTYQGVTLWDLLKKAGVKDDIAESALVQYHATDNYNCQPVTVGEIKNNNLYGYYEKDPDDMGDGAFDSSDVHPLTTGSPVLVAYGFNQYPYVLHASDEGYNSGLGNDGGPLRIIFGKKSYNHVNGSSQVQLLDRIVVGEDFDYTTHSYGDYVQYKDNSVLVKVVNEGNTELSSQTFTLEQLENMIYGSGVAQAEADQAKVKDYYYIKDYNGSQVSDLYEGVNLWYLLNKKVGLPGTMGTVTLEDALGTKVTLTLDEIRSNGINEVTGKTGLKPALAFAKYGYPMVDAKKLADGATTKPGYVDAAKNSDGFLMLVCPQNGVQAANHTNGINLKNLKEITVKMQTDAYAHLESPYSNYAENTITVSGPGAQISKTFKVSDLEKMQDYIVTADYCVAEAADNKTETTFRGIDLYQFLQKEVGLQSTTIGITVTASDGLTKDFTLDELIKSNYLNEISGTSNLKIILAYGAKGKPLVPQDSDEGYEATAGNKGGPLKLVVGQTGNGDFNSGRIVGQVTGITVNASATASWKHDHGVYTQYQDELVLRITGDQVAAPRTFTLAELEALTGHIVRNNYTFDGSHQMEGVVLWNLISQVVGMKAGVDTPSSVRIFSGAGYNTSLTNMTQLKEGVDNAQGQKRPIIAAYAEDGYPLVQETTSPGYDNNNQFGPVRLIIENNKSQCVKSMDCIVIGDGSYEDPAVYANPPVFSVSGSGVASISEFSVAQLKALTATTAEYVYSKSGTSSTDTCTGVALDTLLSSLGVTDDSWTVNLITTDGYNDNGAYNGISVKDIKEKNYLLTYAVNGQAIDDTDKQTPAQHAYVRIYRNQNSGTDWKNRVTNIKGIEVIKPLTVFTATDNTGETPMRYTLTDLKGMTSTTATYVYNKGGVTSIENCTGVRLDTLLTSLGVTDNSWKVNLLTTDGYTDASKYLGLALADIKAKNYLVAYNVNGLDVDDVDKQTTPQHAYVRIYRNQNEGTDWRNRVTNIKGIEIVKDLETIPVFSISGTGVGTTGDYSLSQLKAMTASTADYVYKKDGVESTDTCTGVYLDTILAGLGITNDGWQVNLITTDGYTDKGKYTVTLGEIKHQEYLLAYTVNGSVVNDTDGNGKHAYLRIYRNQNSGTDWRNRVTNIKGIEIVKGSDWLVYRNDTNSGLPNAGTRCTVSDDQGGLWVGTNGGGAAYRDQSGKWTVYNTENGLNNNTVYDIAIDDQGGVWFAQGSQTSGKGAAYLLNGVFTYYDKANTNSGLPDDFVQQVEIDSTGGVWFGTAKGASYFKEGIWKVYDKTLGMPAESVNTITLDSKGGVWFGCYPDTVNAANNQYQGGYAYLNAQGQIKVYSDTENTKFADQWVRSISLDKFGGVWVVKSGSYANMETVGGRIDYITPQGEKISYTGKEMVTTLGTNVEIRTITTNSKGGIWIGTTTSGLYYSPKVGTVTAHYDLTTLDWPTAMFNSVWTILAQDNGNVIVGTNGGVAAKEIKLAEKSELKVDSAKLFTTANAEVSQIAKTGSYRVKINLSNSGIGAENALVLMQVRTGTGATALTGGQIIGCIGVNTAIPVTGADVTGEFTLPSSASGKAYVDVFVWDGWDNQNPLISPVQTLSFTIQ